MSHCNRKQKMCDFHAGKLRQEFKPTPVICHIYCVSTATMVSRTRLSVTLCVQWPSCWKLNWCYAEWPLDCKELTMQVSDISKYCTAVISSDLQCVYPLTHRTLPARLCFVLVKVLKNIAKPSICNWARFSTVLVCYFLWKKPFICCLKQKMSKGRQHAEDVSIEGRLGKH
jgi:hypothetical protein